MIGIIKNICSTKKSQEYGTYGTIFSDESFGASYPTLFCNQVGTDATFTGSGVLEVSNSVNGLDNYLERLISLGTLDKYTLRCEYIVTTINSSSDGIAIGIQSSRSSTLSVIFGLLTDSTDLGKLAVWEDNDYGTPVYKSSASINVSANDELAIEIVRDGEAQTYVITAYNTTQDESISYTINTYYGSSPILRSFTGYCSIYSLGGDCEVSLFSQTSPETTNPDYCVIGDSISNRSAATAVGNEYQAILENNLNGEWVTYAGGGDTTVEVLGNMSQIEKINPLTVFLMIGVNDFRNGEAYNDVRDRHQQIVSELEALGFYVIILELIPCTGQNFTTWNNELSLWYPNRKIISLYDELGGNTPNPSYYAVDLVHPNDAGHAYIASLIESQL